MAKKPATARPSPRRRPENLLLRSLPAAVLERLSPELTTEQQVFRDVLHREGRPVTQVYFPNGGVLSITTSLADGTLIETATVGRAPDRESGRPRG